MRPSGLGRGFYFQMEGFENGRLQTAARAVGVMQAAYEQALEYARNRTVFGSNIFEYQLTQVKLGRMAVLIQAGRQFAYAVATMMAKQQGATEASMVKAYVCKAAEWVTREAMQIHGGFGYAEEYAVSRLFVDARVLSIFEGADETLCLKVIARRLVPAAESTRLVAPRHLTIVSIAARSPSDRMRSKSASRMVVVRVEQDRVQTGRRVAPPMSIVTESPTYTIRSGANPGKHGRACSKMRGSGLATPTTWLSTMHRIGVPGSVADLTDTAATELHLDLPGRVGHDAHRYAGGRQLGEAPPSSRGSAIATGAGAGVPSRAAACSRSSIATPTDSTYARSYSCQSARRRPPRLVRHRGVVGAPVGLDRRITAERREQRPEHGRVGQHEHAARVEQHGVEAGAARSRVDAAACGSQPPGLRVGARQIDVAGLDQGEERRRIGGAGRREVLEVRRRCRRCSWPGPRVSPTSVSRVMTCRGVLVEVAAVAPASVRRFRRRRWRRCESVAPSLLRCDAAPRSP